MATSRIQISATASDANDHRAPRVAWYDRLSAGSCELGDIASRARDCEFRGIESVCVVEGLDQEGVSLDTDFWRGMLDDFLYRNGLGSEYFLDQYMLPLTTDEDIDHWSEVFPSHHAPVETTGISSSQWHINGVFQHHHRTQQTARFLRSRKHWLNFGPYPPSSTTRISYRRVNRYLYIFLVDGPLDFGVENPNEWILPSDDGHLSIKTGLRLQAGTARNGLPFPRLIRRKTHNLFESFASIFKHSWHLNILFDESLGDRNALGRDQLLYLLATSLWETNLQSINHEIKRISFEELYFPNLRTNTKLLRLREVLSELAAEVALANSQTTTALKSFYEEVYELRPGVNALNGKCGLSRDNLNYRSPLERLAQLQADAADLQRFLMDTFQLLNSSLSIQETQTGAEQAMRGAKLTQLAFIYVPLSFVTSIFGMNIHEINGSSLPIWVCFATLAIVVLATLGGFASFEYVKKRWPRLRERSSVDPFAFVGAFASAVGLLYRLLFIDRIFREPGSRAVDVEKEADLDDSRAETLYI